MVQVWIICQFYIYCLYDVISFTTHKSFRYDPVFMELIFGSSYASARFFFTSIMLSNMMKTVDMANIRQVEKKSIWASVPVKRRPSELSSIGEC